MKPEQALELLVKASTQYKGTLEEHRLLVQAGQILQKHLGKEAESAELKAKKKTKK